MRDIVTEDIVRNALNESIDEFMLEEGMLGNGFKGLQNWWNNGNGQKIKNGLNNAWNGYKNFLAMYMDNKTNGQWNRKYNIQAKGNGGTVVGYYLQKWFGNHYNRLYDIIYGSYYGNKQYFYTKLNGRSQTFDHDWKSDTYVLYNNNSGIIYRLKLDYNNIPAMLNMENSSGNIITKSSSITHDRRDNSYDITFVNSPDQLKIYSAEDKTTPEEYIAKNCTVNNFNQFTENVLEDGKFKYAAINYINSIQEENIQNIEKLKNDYKAKINYNHILSLFRIENFYAWCGKNKTTAYDNQQTAQQQNAQQQGQQQTTQQQQPIGKKDPNWKPKNQVPIFNTRQ